MLVFYSGILYVLFYLCDGTVWGGDLDLGIEIIKNKNFYYRVYFVILDINKFEFINLFYLFKFI